MTSRNRKPQPGFTRGPRIADLMTREYLTFVESSFAAERVGDAATALDYHTGVPMFTQSRHTYTLRQLAGLADEMTPWLWARWAAYQCNRAEDAGTQSGFITRAAIDYTIQMFYDEQMEAAYGEGRDPVHILMKVVGQSWIYQQVCTFEFGGLREFLDFIADGRLAEHAAWARSWEQATMRGVRLEASEAGMLVVTDLEARKTLQLLDLGAGTLCAPGGYLVGRVVPSGVTPKLMFDSTPVVVDRLTAKGVAESKQGGWVTVLTQAISDGRLELTALESEDRELASDIPSGAMIEAATRPVDRRRVKEERDSGRDVVGRAAFRVLRDAIEGPATDERAPYVAAAMLNPHAYAEAQRKLITPGRPSPWLRWAERAPEPAASRLRHLAEKSSAKAA
jgi:hypothetical protein